MINDSIKPQPDYQIGIDEEDGLMTLTVNEGRAKPFFYRAKAYKRNGSSTVEVDSVELRRLALVGENRNYEELRAKSQDLSFGVLARYLEERAGVKRLSHDILKTLELLSDEEGYCIAAELLADENGYPGIDIARFGASVSIIKDRETFDNMSVLRQYEQAVNMYRRYYTYEEVKGSCREEIQTIPEDAFREAVANAIVHRTWDTNSHIRIAMRTCEIEVMSPGGLPSGISEEEYLSGEVSVLRSPILGNVLHRVRLIERFGTGIPRIMEAYRKSLAKPIFRIMPNSISVTLPQFASAPQLQGDALSVYRSLDAHAGRSSSQIAKNLGFSKTKVVGVLKGLVDAGYARVLGSGRATKYLQS